LKGGDNIVAPDTIEKENEVTSQMLEKIHGLERKASEHGMENWKLDAVRNMGGCYDQVLTRTDILETWICDHPKPEVPA
jgi:hypothetical protein